MATQLKVTVKPSGGDYTTLAQAISANAKNLVTADQYLSVEIDGDWSGGADTSYVNIAGYTTDATRYIEIYTTAAARHSGKWDTTKYRLQVSNDSNGAFRVETAYAGNAPGHIRITGLQIKNTYSSNIYDTSDGMYLAYDNATSDVRIDKCIVYAPQNALRAGFDTIIRITNSVFISQGASSHNTGQAVKTSGHTTVYNSILACTSGGASADTISSGFYSCIIKNVYSYNAGSGNSFGANLTLTTSGSDDATGTSTLRSISYSISAGTFFTSITVGSEDFHIVGASALADTGTDLSATFTDDIDGTVRSGTWDVGINTVAASSSSSSCCSSSSSCRSSSSSSSSRSSSSSSRSSSSSSSCSSSSCSSSSSSCRSSSSSSSSISSSSSSSSRSSSSSSRSSSSSSRSSSSSSSSCRSSSSSCSSRSSSSSSSSCSSSSSKSSSSSSSCRSSSSSSCSSSKSSSSSCSSSKSSSSSSCRSSSSCSSSSSAFLGTSKNYTREDVNGLPTGITDLATIFSGSEYVVVQFEDAVRVSQSTINTHGVFLFKDQFTSNIPFTVTWKGRSNKATTVVPIVLQIYNRVSTLWETLDSNSTSLANTDITLTGSKLSTIANYFDGSHAIVCRVYQQAT